MAPQAKAIQCGPVSMRLDRQEKCWWEMTAEKMPAGAQAMPSSACDAGSSMASGEDDPPSKQGTVRRRCRHVTMATASTPNVIPQHGRTSRTRDTENSRPANSAARTKRVPAGAGGSATLQRE